ncbi:hypothetical protein EW145_g1695 [Phellinidium pouzarii]|uniref:N-acetyltransferase domain-containing protein n=1 Tax=Phellinidium pouzarii TaxID=167371 RepID=A0A4S4LFA6_9AGAM|nr:hypothetical protein EW145_g1695 [Phellinidium pouzarii]
MVKRKLSDVYSTSSEDEDEYVESPRKRRNSQAIRTTKRRKQNSGRSTDKGVRSYDAEAEAALWMPLAVLEAELGPASFEEIIQESLAAFLEAKEMFLRSQAEVDHLGQKLRPLAISEVNSLLSQLQQSSSPSGDVNPVDRLLIRKLKLEKLTAAQHRRTFSLPSPRLALDFPQTMKALDPLPKVSPPDKTVIDALMAISTTRYSSSLVARIAGHASTSHDRPGYLHRDWEAQTPWMDLMDDIHEHHSLAHPDREQTSRPSAPIDYQALHPSHILQVHDLLSRTFWPGIDISDSLQYSPEQCTVVATYRNLVVGAAFLSSPQETYITYLAVRVGWESSQIATKMLYTLITRNPRRDILLHVSANNPAMLLYNRFGFKAEEFIVGFYEDYLDRQSRISKNAFRLRLRC